jgi:DNA adenine methylase
MGSKARFVKELLPIILKGRKKDQYYVEPFAGGMNMISEVKGNRIANDLHPYLIPMWKAFVYDNFNPNFIEKDQYTNIRLNQDNFPDYLVGWCGFACSYSGKWFGGYAGYYPENRRYKNGYLPCYQSETLNSIKKQIPKLKGVEFYNLPYNQVPIPPNSIIYCDPPYENTSKYKTGQDFNHIEFWEWCRIKSKKGHTVYISEYNAPLDFKCIWSKETSSQLSANGKSGGSKISTEKLFIFSDTYNIIENNKFF